MEVKPFNREMNGAPQTRGSSSHPMSRSATKIWAKDTRASGVRNVCSVAPPERAVGSIALLPTIAVVAARSRDGATDDQSGDTCGNRSAVTVATTIIAATTVIVASSIVVATNAAVGISEGAISKTATSETATALAGDLMHVGDRRVTSGCRCRHRRCYDLRCRQRADCRRSWSRRRCARARQQGNCYGSGELSHMILVKHVELLFPLDRKRNRFGIATIPGVSGCSTQRATCMFRRVMQVCGSRILVAVVTRPKIQEGEVSS